MAEIVPLPSLTACHAEYKPQQLVRQEMPINLRQRNMRPAPD